MRETTTQYVVQIYSISGTWIDSSYPAVDTKAAAREIETEFTGWDTPTRIVKVETIRTVLDDEA